MSTSRTDKNHWHCPSCGRVLDEVFRLSWNQEFGVVTFLLCNPDKSVYVIAERLILGLLQIFPK